jgi:Ni,Fe-hydrogenase III small subunit
MAINLKKEADLAGAHPSRRFGQRERKLLEAVAAEYPKAVVAAGTFQTVGGDAAETITLASVEANDIVMVSVKTAGASPVTVAAASAAAGSISVTMSADPAADHVLQYIVVRALA